MVRPRAAALEDTRLTEAEKASSVLLLAMYSRTQAALGTDLVRAAQLAKEAGESRGRGARC